MSSAAQAIAKAKATTRWTVGMCDQFVARMYGFDSSGYATAVKNWQSTPGNLRKPGDWNAPAGALMYWSGGSTGAGHVAISLGNGSIISTDATGPGVVSQVNARLPTDKWGLTYLGWSYPYFQGKEATNSLGTWSGSTSATNTNATNAGLLTTVTADAVTAGFLSGFQDTIKSMMGYFVWSGEVLIAIVLMYFGAYLLVKG